MFVYNKTGTMLIQFSKDQSGDNLFDNIYSLTVSQDGKRIYVADKQYGLAVLSKECNLHGNINLPTSEMQGRYVKKTVEIYLFVVNQVTILYTFLQMVR
jgi:hypothetical protein